MTSSGSLLRQQGILSVAASSTELSVFPMQTYPEKAGHFASNDSGCLGTRVCYLVSLADLDEFVLCSRVLVFVRVPMRQNQSKKGSEVPLGGQNKPSASMQQHPLRWRWGFIPGPCSPCPNLIPKHRAGTHAVCLQTCLSI